MVARARSGAPVAVPVTWGELGPLGRGDALHVGDLAERLLTDAWAGAAELRQGISAAALRALSIG